MIARAFEKRDLAAVRRELPNLGPLDPSWPYYSVLVVVESVDHVVELLDLLPGWRVFCRSHDTRGLSPETIQALRSRWETMFPHPSCCVVTHAMLHRLECKRGAYDVVIRADGGRGLPCLPSEVLASDSDDPACRLRLIDVADQQTLSRERDSMHRRFAYVDAGWTSAVPHGAGLERQVKHLYRRRKGAAR